MTTLTSIILFLLALIVVSYGISRLEKRNDRREREFESLYDEIWDDLKKPRISEVAEEIRLKLKRLRAMHWSSEKCDVLRDEFMRRFEVTKKDLDSIDERLKEINQYNRI